jgi:hypothetical protein
VFSERFGNVSEIDSNEIEEVFLILKEPSIAAPLFVVGLLIDAGLLLLLASKAISSAWGGA